MTCSPTATKAPPPPANGAERAGPGQRNLRNRERDARERWPFASPGCRLGARVSADRRGDGGHSCWRETPRDLPGRGHARRPRCRLRRHRHQPALCLQGGGPGGDPRRHGDAGRGAGHRVAHPVGADPDHLDQIRAPHPARRQPRRRRHRRPAGAAVGPQRRARHLARAAPGRRPGGRGAALRRRRHHAGDLRARAPSRASRSTRRRWRPPWCRSPSSS